MTKLTPELQRAIVEKMKILKVEGKESLGLRAARSLGVPEHLYQEWMNRGTVLKFWDPYSRFYMAVMTEEIEADIKAIEDLIRRAHNGDETAIRLAYEEAPGMIQEVDRLISMQKTIKYFGLPGRKIARTPAIKRACELRESLVEWTKAPMRG